MSLRYSYTLVAVNHPVIPLGGRWVRPRPLISVGLLGPTGAKAETAQLDTGAADTVFMEDAARAIGVDLSNAPAGFASGVGVPRVPVRYAEVTLRIADIGELREWKAWVGFTPARLNRPLLGFAGFLQFFSAHFRGDVEEVELIVNRLYAGS
jgi:hypothetical protein